MNNKKTNFVNNFVHNLVNNLVNYQQQKEAEKMEILENQEQLIATTYEEKFYNRYCKIIDDVDIQKLILLANRVLLTSTKIASDFKISIGYSAFNKLMPSGATNQAIKSNKFKWLRDEKIEDIKYCFANPQEFQDAQLYFILNEHETLEDILITEVSHTEETRDIDFLELLKTKINLLDLMLKDFCFNEDLKCSKLLNCYFKFDVKYDQNYGMQNNSTLKIIFHVLDDSRYEIPLIKTFVWRYDLKAFISGLPVEPKLKVISALVTKMSEVDFFDF